MGVGGGGGSGAVVGGGGGGGGGHVVIRLQRVQQSIAVVEGITGHILHICIDSEYR